MDFSRLFIFMGLIFVLIGCFIEIIGMLNIKNKDLYSSILLSGFLEQNFISSFKLKYRQIEGFVFILIGSVFQSLPNIVKFNFNVKISRVIKILLVLIVASFITDKIVIKFAKQKYSKELERRKKFN